MKNLVAQWKEGWRESIYFIKFIGALYIGCLFLLIIPTGIVTELTQSDLFFYAMILLWLLFGFPLVIHWAFRTSGFRVPTKEEKAEEETLETQQQAEKVYEEIRKRNSPPEKIAPKGLS